MSSNSSDIEDSRAFLCRMGFGQAAETEPQENDLDALRLYPGSGEVMDEHIVNIRYVPVKRLGAGGFGEAFLAIDVIGKREVVLKTIRSDYLRLLDKKQLVELMLLFQRETEALSQLPSSPQLVRQFYVLKHRNRVYQVLEYLAGGALHRHCGSRYVRTAIKLAWLRDVAGGLSQAHAVGILHCDVKPSNIMLRDASRAALIDFGIARIVSKARHGLAEGGADFFGTRRYAAPEVLEHGMMAASVRSDIFSFGITALELITGSIERTSDHGVELGGEIAWFRFRELFEACIARSPDNRPNSIDEVFDHMNGLFGQLGWPMAAPGESEPRRAEDDAVSHALVVAGYNIQQAIGFLTRVASDTASDSELRALAEMNLSYLLASDRVRRYEEALAAAERAIASTKQDSESWFLGHVNAANALHYLGRAAEGLEHCDLADRNPPSREETRYDSLATRGMLLIGLGLIDRAEELVSQAHMDFPLQSKLDGVLAAYWLKHGMADRAFKYARRYAELNSTDLAAVYNFAICLIRLDRREEALAWLEHARQIDPVDKDTICLLATELFNAGHRLRAAQLLPEALAAEPASFRAPAHRLVQGGWANLLGNTRRVGLRDVFKAVLALRRIREALNGDG